MQKAVAGAKTDMRFIEALGELGVDESERV
jgi:hypothetical protein